MYAAVGTCIIHNTKWKLSKACPILFVNIDMNMHGSFYTNRKKIFFLQCLCYLPFVSIKNSSHTHLSVDNVKSPNMSPASPLLAYSPQLTNRVNEVSAYLSARPPPRYRLHHPPQRRCWSWARLPQTAGSPPPGCLRGACRRRSWRRWTSGSWLSPVR